MSNLKRQDPPKPIYTFRPSNGAITSLKFISGGLKLLSGCATGVISLWCLKTFHKLHSWNCHDGKDILWIGCHNDKLYSQGRDQFVRKWASRTDSWFEDGKIEVSSYGFCNCDIVDNMLVSPTRDHEIMLTSLSDQETVLLKSKDNHGMSMCLKAVESATTNFVLCGYENGTVVVWDIRKPDNVLCDRQFYTDPIMCLDYNDVERKGLCGSSENELKMWSMEDESIEELRTIEIKNPGVASIRIRNDRLIFAAGSWDARLRIFGFKKGKPLAVLDHHSGVIQSLAFSDCCVEDFGQLLAAGSKDEKISIWNIYGNK